MMFVTFFLSGIAFASFALAGVFFLKLWKASRDQLFLSLFVSFMFMAVERIMGIATYCLDPSDLGQASVRSWVYLFRVVAFVVIVAALIQKNLSLKRKS